MALRTRDDYLAGLRDARRVHLGGVRVDDVVAHPDLAVAISHSALAFDISFDERTRSLAVASDRDEPYSAFYRVPRSLDELEARGELIETQSAMGGGTIVLKEVGTDALLGLLDTLEGVGLANARRLHDDYRDRDVAISVAQTDVKGDRSRPPHLQKDPDLYLRVVDEDNGSLVVRGAKAHTSFSMNADELIVLPTRAMTPDDADYAVAFAIPIDTEGLHLYVSAYGGHPADPFEQPLSSRHRVVETLTVFDDVVVPRERVFLNRQPAAAGPLALAFANFHRFTAISYKLALVDLMVGAAFLIAAANGIDRTAHVRDKLADLVAYAETLRALRDGAVSGSRPSERGIYRPDPLLVNTAKYHFAHGFSPARDRLIDLAGGLLVTGPGGADWSEPATREVLDKYYAAAVAGSDRLAVINLVGDLLVRDFGGYQAVLAAHAEGSVQAEKLQLLRSFDPSPSTAYAEALAGIADADDPAPVVTHR